MAADKNKLNIVAISVSAGGAEAPKERLRDYRTDWAAR